MTVRRMLGLGVGILSLLLCGIGSDRLRASAQYSVQMEVGAGNTYYVGPTGSDANPGTRDRPWATPGYGSRQLQPGDTLIILGGRYVLSEFDVDILMPPSGTANAWITIRGEEGNRPVLAGCDNLYSAVILAEASYVQLENLEITHDSQASGQALYFRTGIAGSGSPVSHVVLKDLYIHHIDEGAMDFQDVDDLQVINCRMEYCGFGGMGGPAATQGGWRNVRVQGCTLSWSGHYYQGGDGSSRPYDRPDGFGIEPSQGPIEIVDSVAEHNYGDGLDSKATNTTIRRCVVANNSCDGVKLWGGGSRVENTLIYGRGDGNSQSTPWAAVVIGTEQASARIEIVNCTLDDTLGGNYLLYAQYDNPDVPVDLMLQNTIFRGIGSNSPLSVGEASTLTARNNLFYLPNTDHVLEHGSATFSASNLATLGSGNLYGDPLLVAPAWGQTGNYHLTAGSPAIHAGSSAGAPLDDLEENARGASPDIGAFQYADTTPAATPTVTPSTSPTATVPPGGPATLTLQQGGDGYAGCVDTYIYQYAPGSNYCGQDALKVGYKQQYAALLRFDLGSVPGDAVIDAATLQVYANGWGGANATLGAYGLLRTFGACQATWNQASAGVVWGLPGANDTALDRHAMAESSVTTSGIGRWYVFDIRALVQGWVSGQLANAGLLLRANYANSSLQFASAEHSNVALRPKLVITYRSGLGATPTPTASSSATPTHTPTPGATATGSATTCTTLQRGTQGSVADAYVWASSPDYTGNWENLYTGIVGDGRKRSLLRFDLAGLPSGAVVDSATLSIYLYSGDAGHTINVHRITSTWSESAVTWNNFQNAYDSTPGSSFVTGAGWCTASVTGLVQAWINGAYVNYGLLLDDPASSGSATYYASEYGTLALRPELEICYHTGTPASPTPTSDATSTFTPTRTPTCTSTPSPTHTATHTPIGTATSVTSATSTPTATTPATETTLTLQQGSNGYMGGEDTYIYQYAPSTNYCGQDWIKVGYKQQYATLLHFDLSGIPSDALVTQAILQVYANGWGGANLGMDAFRVLRPISLCQTTWSVALSGNAWGLPGANDTSTDRCPSAESSIVTSGISKWYSLNLSQAVQDWVSSPLSNQGVLLRAALSNSSFQFASAQSANAALRPKLVIAYRRSGEPIPTPTATIPAGTSPTPSATLTASATATATCSATPTDAATRTATPTATRTPSGPDDPNPPTTPVKLIFIHHSTGQNWLEDGSGRLGIALRDNNYFVSDTNYGWGPGGIGNSTDIGHWWSWFVGPNRDTYTAALYQEYGQYSSYSRLASDLGGENEIVMFKSCFPNSQVYGNPTDVPTVGENALRGQSSPLTVANAKGIYNDLLSYFSTRQDKLFVVITAPPLVQAATDAACAANARALNNWLVNDWLASYPYSNVAVFDFYTTLTSNGGNVNTTDVGAVGGNHHRWRNNAVEHIQTVANNYCAYGSSADDSHPTAAGGQKASAEFVSLLNVFYHRWKAVGGVPTPTLVNSPTPTRMLTPTATPTSAGLETMVTLQPGSDGYAGCDDTYIYQYAPANNYCAQDALKVGYKQQFAALMRFDLTGIPSDAVIVQATLQLYATGWGGSNASIGAYCVLRDADACQSTWNQARVGSTWGLSGCNDAAGDRRGVADASLTTSGINKWYDWDLSAAVQGWVDGSLANHGILLRAAYSTASLQFASAQHGNLALRPRLVLTYRTVAMP